MDGTASSGPSRLGGAGIGSIAGGVTLGMLSFLVPYTLAAAGALAAGIVVYLSNRRQIGTGIGVGLGCAAVGVIGLVEASGLGFGIAPLVLATVAVGAGTIDIFIGVTFDRFRRT